MKYYRQNADPNESVFEVNYALGIFRLVFSKKPVQCPIQKMDDRREYFQEPKFTEVEKIEDEAGNQSFRVKNG